MPDDQAPEPIRRLAEARREARGERDWVTADRLKAEIEAAGWKVVDVRRGFALERSRQPDVEDGGVIRYGSSDAVPSVLDAPPTVAITMVRTVPDDAMGVVAASVADAGAGAGVQNVLVTNRPLAALPDGEPEVVLLNGWPGAAAALNAGLRRARGAIVAIAGAALEVSEPQLEQLAADFVDPTVAVAGPWGLATDDLRRFVPAGPGDAVAIDGRLLLFRRSDFVERGPLDESFSDPHRLDVWWSLVLRDEGPDEPPRRALVVDVDLAAPPPGAVGTAAGTPGVTSTGTPPDAGGVGEDDAPVSGASRAQRRNFYRLVRAYGGARHLYGEPSGAAPVSSRSCAAGSASPSSSPDSSARTMSSRREPRM